MTAPASPPAPLPPVASGAWEAIKTASGDARVLAVLFLAVVIGLQEGWLPSRQRDALAHINEAITGAEGLLRVIKNQQEAGAYYTRRFDYQDKILEAICMVTASEPRFEKIREACMARPAR